MTLSDRIIPPVVQDDGSVHYSSVTSHTSDPSRAVCYMIPSRIIPVIFVPGIMGSNLKEKGGKEGRTQPVWSVDSPLSIATQWATKGLVARKQTLDPLKTEIDDSGVTASGTTKSEAELRRRGWGEVAAMSYGNFLVWLETALNDSNTSTDYGRKGLRAELMKQAVAEAPGVAPLTSDEVAMSYKYQFPVHAVGYNWLESNVESARRLDTQIRKFMKYYRDMGFMCERVILVTHSMGGLVARYYSEVLGGATNVLGIVHGVMPATGAAAAYKRVKAGTEGMAGPVLGGSAAEVTAVFAQAPGALQLLPSSKYGMHWLKVQDFDRVVSLPIGDPYSEIYLQRSKWWGLVSDPLLNPMDQKKLTIEQDWANFANLIQHEVQPFHEQIGAKYHMNTYVFYGHDKNHKTWGDVLWKRTVRPRFGGSMPSLVPTISKPLGGKVAWDSGLGEQTVSTDIGNTLDTALFVLQDADEPGDGTVPARSGKAPSGQSGVQACVPYSGFEHEGAYKSEPRQRFALWAIIKIAYRVKQTSMAYEA